LATASNRAAVSPLASRFVEAVVVAAAVLAACWWFTGAELGATFWGFPLDDAWIHLQFARNIASGQGFSYNPGIPVGGSTAPLWTVVLAIPARLGLDPVAGAKGLGIVLTLAAALVAGRLAEWLTTSRAAGFFTALALALSPRLIWGALSGMEVSLYSFLGIWAVLSYLRALDTGAPWWGLLAGLAGATRPEVFVLFPILAADWTLRAARRQLVSTSAIRWAAPLLLFAIPAAAFVALNLYTSGHPLPLTFYAKSYGMGTVPSLMEGRWHDAWVDAWRYPQQFFYLLLTWTETEYPDLGLGALVGAAALTGVFGDRPQRRGAYLLVVILVAAPIIKALGAPQPPLLVHEGRYLFHLLILFLVVAVAGLMELHTRLKWKAIVPLYCLVSLIRLGGALSYEAPRYASKVKNINDLEVATAHWIQRETGEDARIATNDIGAIAFFSKRFIIDTEGLVTPEAIHPKRMRRFVPFLESQRPDLLVIFPEWYPEIAARTDLFHEIYRVHAHQDSAGAPHLVIYRTPWTRTGAVPRFVP
jgi:arabinofuranosyltransferase